MSTQSSHFTNSDRERIVAMDVKLERALNDIQDIKNNFAGRIESLELKKLDRIEAEKLINEVRTEIVNHASDIKDDLSKDISLLQRIVYGCIAMILISFFGALITMVYKQ